MKQAALSLPYREMLWTNGAMLALLAGLYGIGRLAGNFGLLLAFLLGAVLFALLELALCLRAWLRGHLQVAIIYGALCLVVAAVDWWLIEQL